MEQTQLLIGTSEESHRFAMAIRKLRMIKTIFVTLLMTAGLWPVQSHATVECAGTVYMIYKTNDMTTPSISVKLANGTITNWVSLPSNTEVAMALTARAGALPIRVAWTASDVTTCSNGWAQNRGLQGFLSIDPS